MSRGGYNNRAGHQGGNGRGRGGNRGGRGGNQRSGYNYQQISPNATPIQPQGPTAPTTAISPTQLTSYKPMKVENTSQNLSVHPMNNTVQVQSPAEQKSTQNECNHGLSNVWNQGEKLNPSERLANLLDYLVYSQRNQTINTCCYKKGIEMAEGALYFYETLIVKEKNPDKIKQWNLVIDEITDLMAVLEDVLSWSVVSSEDFHELDREEFKLAQPLMVVKLLRYARFCYQDGLGKRLDRMQFENQYDCGTNDRSKLCYYPLNHYDETNDCLRFELQPNYYWNKFTNRLEKNRYGDVTNDTFVTAEELIRLNRVPKEKSRVNAQAPQPMVAKSQEASKYDLEKLAALKPIDLLYLLDFDHTLCDGHLHNAVMREIQERKIKDHVDERTNRLLPDAENIKKRQIEYLFANKYLLPPLHKEEIKHSQRVESACKAALTKLVTEKSNEIQKIVIVSFTGFPHVIEKYLREVVGLTEEIASKILVIGWLPKDRMRSTKDNHILQAMLLNNFKGFADIILKSLTQVGVKKESIELWLENPEDPRCGKVKQALLDLIEATNFEFNIKKSSYFVDDNDKNVKNARKLGCNYIEAEEGNGRHLIDLFHHRFTPADKTPDQVMQAPVSAPTKTETQSLSLTPSSESLQGQKKSFLVQTESDKSSAEARNLEAALKLQEEEDLRAALSVSVQSVPAQSPDTKSETKPLRARTPLKVDNKYKQQFEKLIKETKLTLGSSYDGGDCFFDSVAQVLVTQNISIPEDIDADPTHDGCKKLRVLCNKYMKSELIKNDWVNEAMDKDAKSGGQDYTNCLMAIQFTQPEMEKMKKSEKIGNGLSTWGRYAIEGRMICERLNIQIHVIELQTQKDQIVPFHYLVDGSGCKPIEAANYETTRVVHLVISRNHYAPLLNPVAPQNKLAPKSKLRADVREFTPSVDSRFFSAANRGRGQAIPPTTSQPELQQNKGTAWGQGRKW